MVAPMTLRLTTAEELPEEFTENESVSLIGETEIMSRKSPKELVCLVGLVKKYLTDQLSSSK